MAAKKEKDRAWRSEARSSRELDAFLHRLGRRIRTLRQTRGLTQEEVAELARLDVRHYQAIEAGESNMTVASLLGLSTALRVSLPLLFLVPPPSE